MMKIAVNIFLFCLYVGIMAILGLWTDRSIEWVALEFFGKTVDVPLWLDTLLNIVAAPIVLPGNVFCEILRVVMG